MSTAPPVPMDPYKPLSALVRSSQAGTPAPSASGPSFASWFTQSHLAPTSHPAQTYASKVEGKQLLLENPPRESADKKRRIEERERHAREKQARKVKGLTGRERRDLGVWKVDRNAIRYDRFLALHRLWVGYMHELLGLSEVMRKGKEKEVALPNATTVAGMQAKLVKADFHGALLSVGKSKSPSLIGLEGIVIMESENTFKLVTPKNELKIVPKVNSIFSFSIPLPSPSPTASASSDPPLATSTDTPRLAFELHGNNFAYRSGDRAGRKFKHRHTLDL